MEVFPDQEETSGQCCVTLGFTFPTQQELIVVSKHDGERDFLSTTQVSQIVSETTPVSDANVFWMS